MRIRIRNTASLMSLYGDKGRTGAGYVKLTIPVVENAGYPDKITPRS